MVRMILMMMMMMMMMMVMVNDILGTIRSNDADGNKNV